MPDWITYLLIFVIGAASGAYLAVKFSGQPNNSRAGRDAKKALRRLYEESPLFFDGLREDLNKPEFRQVREFAIVASSRITFVSDVLRLVYYEEDIPNLKMIVDTLEEGRFVDNVASAKTPVYRLRESFVSALEAL